VHWVAALPEQVAQVGSQKEQVPLFTGFWYWFGKGHGQAMFV